MKIKHLEVDDQYQPNFGKLFLKKIINTIHKNQFCYKNNHVGINIFFYLLIVFFSGCMHRLWRNGLKNITLFKNPINDVLKNTFNMY
ncbi:hypothetical protein BpHYR1_011548 [Brachionus plicatilis]|uniref:Uncharacterized protein n=1 Tax=Brachionus plicatilis TaxID=10195 RepID=A0A3M7QYY4_BRAPC|nr:hypothetical protein BpHYR1_011548 [Brachionus plicatilis]